MKTIVVLKNGEVKMRLPNARILPDGSVRIMDGEDGLPVLCQHKLAAAGIDMADAKARLKARKPTDADLACSATLGDNGDGVLVMDAAEYDARQRIQ